MNHVNWSWIIHDGTYLCMLQCSITPYFFCRPFNCIRIQHTRMHICNGICVQKTYIWTHFIFKHETIVQVPSLAFSYTYMHTYLHTRVAIFKAIFLMIALRSSQGILNGFLIISFEKKKKKNE